MVTGWHSAVLLGIFEISIIDEFLCCGVVSTTKRISTRYYRKTHTLTGWSNILPRSR